MGERKRISANKIKEAKKTLYFARLNNCPTSPRKMRLVADQIRGMSVERALFLLKLSPKEAAGRLYKLLLSAISNWQAKNEGVRVEDSNLYISKIFVDGGRQLKRVQPAPQGRAYRIRKRSNHVTLFLESRNIESIPAQPIPGKVVAEKTEDVKDEVVKDNTAVAETETTQTETAKTKSKKAQNQDNKNNKENKKSNK